MLPPFDLTTLSHAAIGAVGGAGLHLLSFVWRDRERLLHQWRVARDPGGFHEYYDDNEYRAFAVTDDERDNLPRNTAWLALVGAAGFVGFMAGSETMLLILFVATSIVAIVRVLLADGAQMMSVEAAPDQQEAMTWRKRLTVIGGELTALLILGFSFMTMPEGKPLREWTGISTDHGVLAGSVLFLGAMIVALVQAKRERDENAVPEEGYRATWDDGGDIALPLFVGIGIIVAIAMIASIVS